MKFFIFILLCLIGSTMDQARGMEYTACLSNNGKGERGYEYFFKTMKDKLIKLYVAESKEDKIKTSDFLILSVPPGKILSFVTNILPSLAKNEEYEYFCSYIKSKSSEIEKIPEIHYNKLHHLIDFVHIALDDKIPLYEDYQIEINDRKFEIRNEIINEKIVSRMITNIESGEFYKNENYIDEEILVSDNIHNISSSGIWKFIPDFFIMSDKKAPENDLKLISETLKKKIEQKYFVPGSFFVKFFRSFHEDEKDLFLLIFRLFFDEKSLLRKEFAIKIFEIDYTKLKDFLYENLSLQKLENKNYTSPTSLEDMISTKENFIKVFEKYIAEKRWNDFISEVRNILQNEKKDRNYIIISTSSDLGCKIKNYFQKILANDQSAEFLTELSFFGYKLIGEVKTEDNIEILLDSTENQVNSLNESPTEKKDDDRKEIVIEWAQAEFIEESPIKFIDEHIIFNNEIINSFTGIDFENFNLKIYTEEKVMKFLLQTKTDKLKSYKFDIVLNLKNFNEFTLNFYTDGYKYITLHSLDPTTWILSLIEKFLRKESNIIPEFRPLNPGELFNGCNYYLNHEEEFIRKFEKKFDFLDRMDFFDNVFENFNLINFKNFCLNKSFMMTNKGLVFKKYRLKEAPSKFHVNFFYENEVFSFINRENCLDSKGKNIGMVFETMSLIDFILTFNDLKEDCEKNVILRIKSREFLKDNRIIKFINNLFKKGFDHLRKENKKTILYDFLIYISKKSIWTCSYNTSYKISKLLYDKRIPLKKKIDEIIQISINSLYLENYFSFISEGNLGGRYERDVEKLLYYSITGSVLPEISKIIQKELEKVDIHDLLKMKKESCVFELSVFYQPSKNDIKDKSKRIKKLIGKISKWGNNLK